MELHTAPTGSIVHPEIVNQSHMREIDGYTVRDFYLCGEQYLCFPDHAAWEAHRQLNHDLQHASTIPGGRMVQHSADRGESIPLQIAPTENPTIDAGTVRHSGPNLPIVTGLQPASAKSDIYKEFEYRSGIYYSLLPPCIEKRTSYNASRMWMCHRTKFHGIPEEENNKIPTEWEFRRWLADGILQPNGVSVNPKAENKPGKAAGSSLAGLQPASVESDMCEQFETFQEDGRQIYCCLLPPCVGEKILFTAIQEWQDHRNHFHELPVARKIRTPMVPNGKRRPSDVPLEPSRTGKMSRRTAATMPRRIPAADQVEASSQKARPWTGVPAQKRFDVGAPDVGLSGLPAQKKICRGTKGYTALRARASSGPPTDSESFGEDATPVLSMKADDVASGDSDDSRFLNNNLPQDSDDSSYDSPENSIHTYRDYVRRAVPWVPSRSSTSSIQSDCESEPEVTSAALASM